MRYYLSFFFFSLSFFCFAIVAYADTEAEKVFGKWEKVTVATMTKPVPEWVYGTDSPGSVTTAYRNHALPVACPVYESGRVVGGRPCKKDDEAVTPRHPLISSASDS